VSAPRKRDASAEPVGITAAEFRGFVLDDLREQEIATRAAGYDCQQCVRSCRDCRLNAVLLLIKQFKASVPASTELVRPFGATVH
jgi:hypothetical protein